MKKYKIRHGSLRQNIYIEADGFEIELGLVGFYKCRPGYSEIKKDFFYWFSLDNLSIDERCKK